MSILPADEKSETSNVSNQTKTEPKLFYIVIRALLTYEERLQFESALYSCRASIQDVSYNFKKQTTRYRLYTEQHSVFLTRFNETPYSSDLEFIYVTRP